MKNYVPAKQHSIYLKKEESMPLNVTVEKKQEGVYAVMPEGHLDSTTSLMFEEEVTPLFAASTKVLIFDLCS